MHLFEFLFNDLSLLSQPKIPFKVLETEDLRNVNILNNNDCKIAIVNVNNMSASDGMVIGNAWLSNKRYKAGKVFKLKQAQY